jgi:ATP synthase protein I
MVDRPTDGAPRVTGSGSAGAPQGDPDEEAALAARLERLGESLEAHRSAQESTESKGKTSGFGQAIKIASEFVAGIVVGAGLGWLIDRALGTSPFALIVFLLLGFAAGVLNVLRAEGVVADAGARLRQAGRDKGSKSEKSDL